MPKQSTGEALLKRLKTIGLISDRQCAAFQSAVDADRLTDSKHVVAELVKRKLITRWQLAELNAGRDDFLLENGRYVLLEKIGQGGMGAVYRARHTRMKRDVALKVTDPGRATDRSLLDRFRREVAICSQLEHEHIVRTHDVGDHDGALFLVMEYVEGSDLASLVRRDGTMSPGEVAAIGVQVAAALAYAHAKGIVHRDIKPSNLLLPASGNTKVLDMGLARITEHSDDATITELTQDGAVMGTVDFMSPEQARDSHTVDPRSDIYSLGAALYFLLCGRPPYPGGTTIEKLHRLANEDPQPLGQIRPDCPRELDVAIQKMMAKSAAERFQTAEDVVRVLRPLAVERLAGRPVVTTAVQTAAETHRETKYQSPAETLPDFVSDETVYSTIQRRKTGVTAGWWIGGAIVLTLMLFLVGWSVWGPDAGNDAEVAESSETVPQSATPVEPIPPADVRVEIPGHIGGALALDWSPNSLFLASGGGDGVCHVWNPNTGNIESTYSGHTSSIFAIAWSHDGRRIASAEFNGEIHLWEAMSGRRLFEPIRFQDGFLHTHQFNTQWIDFAPNGNFIAFVGTYGVVVWDIEASQAVWSATLNCGMLRYSRDGRLLAAAGAHGDVMVWDAMDGQQVFKQPKDNQPGAIAFQQDGTLLISSLSQIQRWDVEGHELLGTTAIPPISNPWNAIWFSPGGSRCAVVTDSGELHVVEVATGVAQSIPMAMVDPANVTAISPAMDLFARSHTSSTGIGIRQLPGNAHLRTLGHHGMIPQAKWIRILADRFLQTGSYAGGVAAITWDLRTGEPIDGFPDATHITPTGEILGIDEDRVVRYRLDGSRAIADVTVATLTSTTESPIHFPTGATLRFSGDGSCVYSDNRFLDSTEFRLWDTESGELIRTINLGQERTHGESAGTWAQHNPGPHISESGEILALAYGAPSGIESFDGVRIWDGSSDEPAREFSVGLFRGANHAALTPDGKYLAVCGTHPSSTYVFDAEAGRLVATLETHLPTFPLFYDFSGSGELLLTTRQIWDWRTETMLWECPEQDRTIGPANYWNYRGGALFSDDRHVVIAQDGQYQVWDWRENEYGKRATLYLLPGADGFVFVNHENGHWTGSPPAYQYVRIAFANDDGDVEWMSPHAYRERTGWENDPALGGLEIGSD